MLLFGAIRLRWLQSSGRYSFPQNKDHKRIHKHYNRCQHQSHQSNHVSLIRRHVRLIYIYTDLITVSNKDRSCKGHIWYLAKSKQSDSKSSAYLAGTSLKTKKYQTVILEYLRYVSTRFIAPCDCGIPFMSGDRLSSITC